MSEQICRFCHRYVQLVYYCEDCGTNSCSNCLHEQHVEYYICQDCNSKNINISGAEKKNVCKDCGSINVIKVSQLKKSCPKCNSHQIVNIYEKKEDLEKRFLELIKNTRLYIEPLKKVLNKLYMLQQKLKTARAPPFKCYHYPKMESDLLALFKLFQYIQNTLFEKINVHFHQLNQNQEYFFDTYTQPNSNITIIEGIFENLVRSYDSINEFITNNIKTFDCSQESMLANLQFIDKITLFFTSYKKLLNLAEKEKPVFAVYAKLANGLDTQEKYKKDKGILFITNFDLSFVHEHGVIKKKKQLIFKAPVEDLTKIREKGKLFKKLYIEFAYGKYEFSLPKKSVSRIIEYILLARTFDETTIYDEKTAARLQKIDINLGDLESFIEESINSFFSLKCQYNKSSEKAHNYKQMNLSQHNDISPNQIQSIASQNPVRFFRPQNQNLVNPWSNEQFNPYYDNANFPGSTNFYPGNPLPPYNQPSGFYPPEKTNQVYPSRFDEKSFFMQNFNNPNRIQNYFPRKFSRYNPELLNSENRNFLKRKLMQSQKYNDSFINQFNALKNDEFEEKEVILSGDTRFQEYNKNHLTDLFDSGYASPQNFHGYKKKLFKLNKEKQKRMVDLEKERYSLKQTLKKLDNKFDQGVISDVDFFKTFKNLQKEIYLIDKKIQSLKESLAEIEEIKQNSRNFDEKRFY